ncbi:MAG: Lrp/AsnC family transcriptional regulator [Cytophagales bacterium]|nr:Lrp/AsnC family transcriptional regulator [Cytophagales bacterium]MDW8384192.1 Lrp/AsnC family transcriptional regulator [Flammeovirgaceae bacterium]
MNQILHRLDEIDKKILHILQSNAKITNAQLSKEIDLSPAPTLERVKKLEALGAIESYHAKVNARLLGMGVTTFINIKLARHNKETNDAFIEHIHKIDEVIECHYVTGSSDYLLKVVAQDIEAYQKIISEKLSAIDFIIDMQTMVILSTVKDSKVIPIP